MRRPGSEDQVSPSHHLSIPTQGLQTLIEAQADSLCGFCFWKVHLVGHRGQRSSPGHSEIMVEYTEEDPKPQLEEACKVECLQEWHKYKECVKRVETDESGEAHCTGWAFDYWKCIDRCVAPKLFAALK